MPYSVAAKSLQSCLTLRPHRWQPTRLPRLWDSPGKNTGVDCHFLIQCMKVKSESEVVQSCPTLSDLMDCSLPGSSLHGIFQARVLECALFYRVAIKDIAYLLFPFSVLTHFPCLQTFRGLFYLKWGNLYLILPICL